MNDVAGRQINIGDKIAATYVGSPDLRIGVVTRFTPKKVVVGFKGLNRDGSLYEEHKFSSQVCII